MARGLWLSAAAVVTFSVWTAASAGHPFEWCGVKADYYNLLTDGFLAGHLYLRLAPVPELLALPDPFDPVANARYRVNDLSLYHGRFFLYFGPVPVLTLFLPWRVLTHSGMTESCAALIYVTAGYILSVLLLELLARRRMSHFGAAAVCVLGFGGYGVILLRDPGVYGVAIAAGYCFFMAGAYCFARVMTAGNPQPWLAAAAGVWIGLTFGCRPQYVLAAVVLSAVMILGRRRETIWFAVPVALCGILALWYNFARFGNVFEFGTSYQLTARVSTRGITLHLRNIVPGLYYLLLCPPRLWDQFPYLVPRYVGPNPRLFVENAVGLLVISPLAVAGLALPMWIRRCRTDRLILVALYGSALAVLLFISLTGYAVGRYLLDFAPALLVVSMCGWLCWRRRGVAAVMIAGTLWTTAMGAALSLGFNDILRDRNPRLFRRLAHWSGQSGDSIRLPVDGLTVGATVRFPARPGATREALLVTGRPGAEDCLFVEYAEADRVRFGYEKAVVGTTLGPEMTLARDREHRLGISYSGTGQRLSISIDGLTVWSGSAAFYPSSRNEVAIGRGPAAMADVRPFSGSLRALQCKMYAAGHVYPVF